LQEVKKSEKHLQRKKRNGKKIACWNHESLEKASKSEEKNVILLAPVSG
jgi:hypothetical protein